MLRLQLSALALLGTLAVVPAPRAAGAGTHAEAVAVIDDVEIEGDVSWLAAPEMEGRDAPSEGFRRAGKALAGRLASLGYEPAADAEEMLRRHGGGAPPAPKDGGEGKTAVRDDGFPLYHRPYTRELWKPVESGCELVLELPGEAPRSFTFGRDFVPLLDCDGKAEAPIVFAGFGIDSDKNRYDDLRGVDVEGHIVVILEGEPRHPRKFGGDEEFEAESNVWDKLGTLSKHGDGPEGVLVVRRRPAGSDPKAEDELDFRHTHASFAGVREPIQTDARRAPVAQRRPPVLEISMACASELFGVDVEKLAERVDKSAKPAKIKPDGKFADARVRMRSKSELGGVRCDNVVGVLRGSDPALKDEYVLVGAHYDHIGVNPGGVVGAGADDNASGVSALLQVAEAFSVTPPRRSVIVCFFGSEEDGLHGSKAVAQNLPVPKEAVVAMVNLDMIGRGDAKEVAVLGLRQNPKLEDVLDRAKRLSKTGITKLVTGQGEELFARSDQYSFHEVGLPVLFFFEGLPISRNEDYHTWRDVPELVDAKKIRNTARLAYNTAWLLANDDDRPPPPAR
ncbi:MAG: M20/M25/M40 family metallo-hydrolase [Planctomycetes bacterium]|nr:M20/M25/M40 family metallo-hydrolase [Planctomycetota bacterium]